MAWGPYPPQFAPQRRDTIKQLINHDFDHQRRGLRRTSWAFQGRFAFRFLFRFRSVKNCETIVPRSRLNDLNVVGIKTSRLELMKQQKAKQKLGFCHYRKRDHRFCKEEAGPSNLCYWHDPDQAKDNPKVKEWLEGWAKLGRSMEGFALSRADLDGLHLLGHGGCDARDADLNHASLKGAHLFHINLDGANLFKADLGQANLNNAVLSGTDLLRANLSEAKLDHVKWGSKFKQDQRIKQANKAGKPEEVRQIREELEEVYRHLKQVHEQNGHFLMAGQFSHREMVVRRKLMPLFSVQRFTSKLVDLISGYSEKPSRVVLSSMAVIFMCAVVYFFTDVQGAQGHIGYTPGLSLSQWVERLGDCIYFSVVTFTTLGYGDMTPRGWAKAVAATEAFGGAFGMSLFVVTFAKRMTR